MGTALEAVGLAKRYGRQPPVFDGVAFVLRPGTVTRLTGGNGSGKSTLLRIVAGLTLPSSGEILGRGRELALVPERFVPPGNLTASSYLTQLGRVAGKSADVARRDAMALLDRLRLDPGPGVAMRLLSKGNAQKVAIAQAFATASSFEAGLVVLDEPRTGLDSNADAVLDELVTEAGARGAMILLSGHEERMPALAVDQRLHLADGTLSVVEAPAGGVEALGPSHRIRLSATPGSVPLASLLAGLGLLSETAQPDGLPAEGESVVVPAASVDAVLRRALANGWSVREVREAHEVREARQRAGRQGEALHEPTRVNPQEADA